MNFAVFVAQAFAITLALKFGYLPNLSWWWVTAPLWAALVLTLLVAAGAFISAALPARRMGHPNA